MQIEKETQWHFDSKFFFLLRENTHHQPYTLTHTHTRTHLSSHNFIGWHATVVNDKGIDTLDSMMFGLFIFMYVFSYLLNGLCSSTAAARWFFFHFSSARHSFSYTTIHWYSLLLYLYCAHTHFPLAGGVGVGKLTEKSLINDYSTLKMYSV